MEFKNITKYKNNNYKHIDTDILSDVDDAIAITEACLLFPEKLVGITTVNGDTKKRARGAKKLTVLLGKNIPVGAGLEKTINGMNSKWTGTEGNGYLDDGEYATQIREDGVQLLYKNINKYAGQIDIISIAPMTNIAALIQIEGAEFVRRIHRIYFMGKVKEENGKYVPNEEAHNVKVDPRAARIVFESGVPITVINTEICKQNWFAEQDWKKITESGKPWADFLYKNAQNWRIVSKYKNMCYLYDPLVVYASHLNGIIETEKRGNIEVSKKLLVEHYWKELLELIT